jgi:hypothetical protein
MSIGQTQSCLPLRTVFQFKSPEHPDIWRKAERADGSFSNKLLMGLAERIDASLYSFLQILSVNAFEKVPLDQLLTKPPSQIQEHKIRKQLAFNW